MIPQAFREEHDSEGNLILLQLYSHGSVKVFSKLKPACTACKGTGVNIQVVGKGLPPHSNCLWCHGTGYAPVVEADKEIEVQINGDNGQLEEKEQERNQEDEPIWTEVRGIWASFHYICPICGSCVPGTGPEIMCADNKKRRPKELHEWWHKAVHCDWYQD